MDITAKQTIAEGKAFLGIELGSTRIKAVLIGKDYAPVASGSHDWENRLENGYWTYSLPDVWAGIQSAYAALAAQVRQKYGIDIVKLGGMGVSAMMHGYLAFNNKQELLVPFRTWRNTTTAQAAEILTQKLQFNIPHRWSIAHLYQAMLNKEPHVKDISFITTLAGYVHWQLTSQQVIGVGDASGMFPINSSDNSYNAKMIKKFDDIAKEHNAGWQVEDIMPRVIAAGENAGSLTLDGAKLLDPTGTLQPDIPFCPPEGDAGTGMVATNSVKPRTGNISAGTSIFAMVVLEKELSRLYPEIDMVTTPAGSPVAMVHCNNCTSDLDAWVKLFAQVLSASGAKVSKAELYDTLYFEAMKADADAGGIVSYNYYSGEPITKMEEGRPLLTRLPDSSFTLANFMRATLYSTMATLKLGMEILTQKENVKTEQLLGHGGLFKTPGVGQQLMAGALEVPVAVMESAGEGGPWGIALLAAYMAQKQQNESLEDFLAKRVFANSKGTKAEPEPEITKGFTEFMQRYTRGLAIERAAVENLG